MSQVHHVLRAASIALLGFGLATYVTADEPTSSMSESSAAAGLVEADIRDFDQAWLRPGFSADEFQAVMIEPAVIEFDPDWGRTNQRTGSRLATNLADTDGTREEMLEVIDRGLRRAIEQDDRFRIVDQPGPDVLRLRPTVDDLYINAIDPMKMATRTDQFVRTMGQGRPGLELLDSVSGKVLMQVADQRETRRYPDLQLATPGLVATDFIEWYRRFSQDALDAMP